MNLYIRYFNNETLVTSVDQAIDFLQSIDEIGMTPELEEDIREYAKSDVLYPKRYKVRSRVYFIIIKTEAATMQDFKDKKAVRSHNGDAAAQERKGATAMKTLEAQRPGWYEGSVNFKRVLLTPTTGKFQYRDTLFVAQVKADSPMDCYNRIIDHLRTRVDERSQFPSVKGKNFKYKFLGTAKS